MHCSWQREPEMRFSNPCTYIIERDGLHHFVLLHRVHLIKVSIGNEDCSVLHLIKAIHLERSKYSVSLITARTCRTKLCSGEYVKLIQQMHKTHMSLKHVFSGLDPISQLLKQWKGKMDSGIPCYKERNTEFWGSNIPRICRGNLGKPMVSIKWRIDAFP